MVVDIKTFLLWCWHCWLWLFCWHCITNYEYYISNFCWHADYILGTLKHLVDNYDYFQNYVVEKASLSYHRCRIYNLPTCAYRVLRKMKSGMTNIVPHQLDAAHRPKEAKILVCPCAWLVGLGMIWHVKWCW